MVASAIVILFVSLMAVLAPVMSLSDPNELNVNESYQPPSRAHFVGTDARGRDQLSRVIHGGRISLRVAFFGVILGVGVGAVWGLVSGYAGGATDAVSQRLVEVLLSIPGIILAFVLAAALGVGLTTVTIAIATRNVGQTARVIRGVALSAKSAEYVTAARAIGASRTRIIALYVAPSCMASLLIIFSAQIGVGIITEATLGFLGVGVRPPTPSWGSLVAEPLIGNPTPEWWLIVVPGAVISLVVLAFNLLGDGLRDELDPRLRGSR